MKRRTFLRTSSLAATGLVIGFDFIVDRAAAQTSQPPAPGVFAPNAFLGLGPGNTGTNIAKPIGVGQGSDPGLATILAEELDADWSQVRVESAPADADRYNNLLWGRMQGTGGSTSIANSWEQLRKAGATARAMLVAGAAREWGVPAAEITVDKGVLAHAGSGRRATFGDLAPIAATMAPPANVQLKDPKDFKLIGRRVPRADSRAKTDGTAMYTIDIHQPDMLTAVIARPPRFGAKLKSFDASAARRLKGVTDVVAVPPRVWVVCPSFLAAPPGRPAPRIDLGGKAARRPGGRGALPA